jgi:regulator of replication initiation timing
VDDNDLLDAVIKLINRNGELRRAGEAANREILRLTKENSQLRDENRDLEMQLIDIARMDGER